MKVFLTQTNKRLVVIGYLFGCLIFILIGRLIYLQISLSDYFFEKSQKNFLRIEKIKPIRGIIYDSNGKPLVTDRPYKQLYWQGNGNKTLSSKHQEILRELEKIIGKEFLTDNSFITQLTHTEKTQKKLLLVEHLSFEQLSKIAEKFPNDANLMITSNSERYYPYQTAAIHLLGHLRKRVETEQQGISGLEQLCETYLKGSTGRLLKTINAMGKSVQEIELEPALSGTNITTTLDIDLQLLIEQAFPSQWVGTFVLIDPLDGAIKAMLSRPHFDPTCFAKPMDRAAWDTLQQGLPFLNRALDVTYPPGSFFKLVTLSAALERNIITPKTIVNCSGSVVFGNRPYWCSRHWGHGSLSCNQAIAQSCNALFFEIGKLIDIDTLAYYAQLFGLGEKTEICLPEKAGIVPSRSWKWQMKNESWWQGETLSVAIGQSFLSVTPLQIARMISAIFTGYLVKPRILVDEPIKQNPLLIKEETRNILQQSMQLAVKKGTGKSLKSISDDLEIYIKTSTAQTSSLEKRTWGPQFLEHGWFVAYFRYKQNNPLCCVILVENAGSASNAAGIAKNFLIEYKKLMNEENQEGP